MATKRSAGTTLTTADRALEAIRAGRWGAALRHADAALAEGSPEPWLPRLRGVALTNLGRVDEALVVLETVAAADPSPMVLHELAAARLAGDDMLGARRAIGQAQAIDAGAPHTRRAAALLAMSNRDWAAAETELRATVLDDQFDIEALNNLAICLARQGRPGEAMEFMRMARSRGQASRHWQLLDQNFSLLQASRRPGDDDAGPLPRRREPDGDQPRPSMGAAIMRARYQGIRNRDPGASLSQVGGGGSHRILMGLLVLTVVVTLVGAAFQSPALAPFAVAAIGVIVFMVLRARRRRLFMILPTSARLRVEPRTGSG